MMREYLKLPRTVHILCLGMLLNRAGSFFITFLTIYLREQLGFSVGFATLVVGLCGLGAMFGAVVGGQLADQVGRRPVMLFSLVGSSCALVSLSFATTRPGFALGVFVFAFIIDMYRPAASAMMGDLVEPEKRQYAFGLMYVSINLGFAIAPPLGGLLMDYSWKFLFWGDALTTSLFALVIYAFVFESSAESPTATDKSPPMSEALRWIKGDTTFLLFCFATFLNATVFMQSVSTLPLAMTAAGMSPAGYGRLIAINGVLIVLLQLPLTKWLSNFDRVAVVGMGSLLIGVGFGTNQFASGLAFFAFTIVIWTTGEMFQASFMQAIVTDLAPVTLRARYQGVFGMMYALSWAVGAPAGGAILENLGSNALWTICFAVSMASASVYWAIGIRVRQRAHEQELASQRASRTPLSSCA